jgi:hypothetical protein
MVKKTQGEKTSRKPRPSEGAPAPALTDDERHALHLSHCRSYETALANKKAYDKKFKDACKLIKAESGSVEQIKQSILARTPEGEKQIRAEVESTIEVLRWSGVEVGETADLFPVDRMPSVERARAEGKRAGLAGEAARPPHDPGTQQYTAWMEGYGDGQAVLARGFRKPGDAAASDDRDLRPDALKRTDEERTTGKPSSIGSEPPTHKLQ